MPGADEPAGDVLGLVDRHVGEASALLAAATEARETGLAACRAVIQASGRSIRALHRHDRERAESEVAAAAEALGRAQRALAPFPAVAHAGFLHDAEKEYVEARATAVFLAGAADLGGPADLGVGVPAWLRGLAEAASELRRSLLDRLRAGDLDEAERLLTLMEGVYDALAGVEGPDAVTGGLRRTVDALRAVLERSRGDLTTAVLLRRSVMGGAGPEPVAAG